MTSPGTGSPLAFLSKVQWKNHRPKKNEAYLPTRVEHLANIATHGLFLFPVFFMAREMLDAAENEVEEWVALVYGCVLIGLFATSTVFHTISYFWQKGFLKELFHRGDRAMIYLFIAGSYTPWLCLKSFPEDSWSQGLKSAVWVLAALGIVYQQIFHEQYKWLETTFYVSIGLAPALAVLEMEDSSGVAELRYGGAAYLTGVIFFKSDGVIPFAHAIWHLHVVLGAMFHFYAVSTYLIDREQINLDLP